MTSLYPRDVYFIYSSILEQTTEAIELAVEGEIPQWLAGKLFRSGPGTLEVDTELGFTYLITHWFDGLTVRRRPPQTPQTPGHQHSLVCVASQVMHGFEIKEGRVYYANQKAARELENYIARHGGYVRTHHCQPAICRKLPVLTRIACPTHRKNFTFGPDPCKTFFSKLSSLFYRFTIHHLLFFLLFLHMALRPHSLRWPCAARPRTRRRAGI